MIVLLVDDNEISLDIQKYMLEGCELQVETAESGEAAVALAYENSYDLIFMDIQMPGMDGFEAAGLIRAVDPDVPIIALSADKIQYDDERFIRSGMNGSIMKPLQQKVLSELVSSYLNLEPVEPAPGHDSGVVFDREAFTRFIPGEAAAEQIIGQFLSIHTGDCVNLRERINAGNILGARELMHDIVGISGNLCCSRLYDAAVALGAELRQGKWTSLEHFAEIWEQTLSELRIFYSSLSPERQEDGPPADWAVVWDDFCTLCNEFDVAAAKLFHRHESLFSEMLSEEHFIRLRGAINRYDFLAIIENT